MKILLYLLSALLIVACSQETNTPAPVTTTGFGSPPPLDFVEGEVIDEPVRSLCQPSARRCLGENSPLYEECRLTGQGWDNNACEDGQICSNGTCADFRCIPGRTICLGGERLATCDDTGAGFRDIAPCPGDEVCRGGACFDLCATAESSDSYIGCDYVAQQLPNYYSDFTPDYPWGVVVANPDQLLPLSATVTNADGTPAKLIERIRLEEDQVTVRSEVLLPSGRAMSMDTGAASAFVPPRSAAVFLMKHVGTTVNVKSSRPAVAAQFSPYCCNRTATNDASLLLPTYTWGSRYRVIGYPTMADSGTSGLQPYVSIIAGPEDTTVSFKSQVPVTNGGRDLRDSEVIIPAGTSLLVSTENRDLLGLNQDLTGTEITTSAPVAVFSGHPCTFVPQDEWACDHLEEQLYPAETLGRRYLLVPTRRRAELVKDITEATYWRIVADEDSTIQVSPSLESTAALAPSSSTQDCKSRLVAGAITLAEGEYCEFGGVLPTTLDSTGNILVAGIISGHQSTGVTTFGTAAGDPSMFLLPPVEQFRSDYSFVSPPTYVRSYVTVAIQRGATLELDRREVGSSSRLERRSLTLNNSEWEVFNIAVEDGVHRLESSSPFGLVVYAYDDYVSYAFSGGLDLVPKGQR